ncbi:hypothetical protein LWI28_010927 [Acer negundo]|uniref:Uncharacterized protein n=1 Tax=Acer negundo TaxID=4023 RepID=A0AAD5JJ22_ACENE|nr:hypothetical protein LWI28_010927 [Acer negundo]
MLSQVAFLQVIPLRWISWLLTPQVVGNSLINLEHNYLSRNLQLFRKPKRTLIGMSEMHLRSGKKESTCLLIFRQITQTQDGVEDDNADEYGYANEFENGTAQALDPATAEQIDTEVNGSKPDEDSLAADHRDDATEMEIYKKGSKSHPIEHHASILKSKMEQLMQISDPNKSPIDKSPEVHRDDDDGAQGSLSESLDDASALWRRYELQTTRLSLELAEQLLLVVEPTLASKLQGDYKTGKRINMKRYNTSHGSTGNGKLSVVSFGIFDQPFTEMAGIKMISGLTFKQENTIADEPGVDLLKFLDNMLDVAVGKA